MESHENADKLIKNLEAAEKDFSKLLTQSNELDAILLRLMRSAKFDANKSVSPLNKTLIDGNTINSAPTLGEEAPHIDGMQ
jgi:uncharacterized protein YdcH (DUF465 family)